MPRGRAKGKKLLRQGIDLEAERARRYKAHLSVLLIDLDNLGLVNKSLGPQAGDELIRAVADVIRSRLRKIDVFGRWQPENFIVLTVDPNAFGAVAVAERIRKVVEESVFTIAGNEVKATVSVGVACGIPKDEESIDALLEAAHKALLRAKAAGRNKVDFIPCDLLHVPALQGSS